MTTPQERLARMRKTFEKNRSVLTADYKYFITSDEPAKPRNKAVRRSAERLASKSQNRS
jgi:hypothetical protein